MKIRLALHAYGRFKYGEANNFIFETFCCERSRNVHITRLNRASP